MADCRRQAAAEVLPRRLRLLPRAVHFLQNAQTITRSFAQQKFTESVQVAWKQLPRKDPMPARFLPRLRKQEQRDNETI